ncbi:translation elongation factor Ts [Candidatus Parcubacteria bacterium]|nr:translation elongation factor Ts [Patescibacteria group bacterium]MBU4309286.1 translation elongation factor Ts [Patescibacteria group bacterium]MBU4431994.1 translation elongation factor Ts [Patescibacteria group bacterium]MBU4577647.1 translation elongation factor Ts [Patescibacteria group bacterium]MCG2697333.1 translation elongation factor Ts [Candidatus Parcubacteria bacterium]
MEKIKQLREITGAGMVECKNALDESGGDIEKAIEIIRKKSGAKAAKKADRMTAEGVVAIALTGDNKKVSVVKVQCESDFVARNDDFKAFAAEVAEAGLTGSAEEYFGQKKDAVILKIGENLTLGGTETETGEFVATYVHSNAKLASVIVFNKVVDAELASGIAMHAVAMAPAYLKPEDVVAEEVEKEKDIYREQLSKEGKPAEMIEKILSGKVSKYYEEVCLLKQLYIKDDKKSVEQVLKEADASAVIEKFIRIVL